MENVNELSGVRVPDFDGEVIDGGQHELIICAPANHRHAMFTHSITLVTIRLFQWGPVTKRIECSKWIFLVAMTPSWVVCRNVSDSVQASQQSNGANVAAELMEMASTVNIDHAPVTCAIFGITHTSSTNVEAKGRMAPDFNFLPFFIYNVIES